MRSARPLAVVVLALALAGCPGGGGSDAARNAPAPPAARAGAAAERWPQPERYSLDLAYDAGRFALTGDERIALRNTGPTPLANVWLRAWGNAFGGCDRRRVKVDVTGGGRAGAERADCTALAVRLPAPLAPGARTTIALRIDVTAPPRPDRFGRFAGAAYFGNALPLLAVADSGGWQRPPYTFFGESFLSLSADWDVRLRLPPGVRAATTGTADGDVTRAFARDFAIVAGPLRLTERRVGGVTVRHWRLRESRRDAARALRLAAAALRAYARWFGPYPRAELDVVEGPHTVARGAGLGMEYPELVLTPARAWVLQHEVAHQWWYAIVGNDEYDEPWLDESFATYSAYRLAERTGRCRPPRGRPRLTASMRVFGHHHGRDYARVVYGGGACALRTLQRGFGRARFDRLLRALVRDHRDGIVTTADFVAAARAAAPPGRDADALLRRAGIVSG
jgi:peptidase M1-like protein